MFAVHQRTPLLTTFVRWWDTFVESFKSMLNLSTNLGGITCLSSHFQVITSLLVNDYNRCRN